MFIAYYDESGDDGYPNYSSPLFVLTTAYLHYLNWKDTYEMIHKFRKQLKNDYGLPIKVELHTKHFLLDKNPYRKHAFSDNDRVFIIDLFCELISQIPLKIITVVINN